MAYWVSVCTTIDRALLGIHSSALRIAVSSATLLVAWPRYSSPSCVLASGDTSTTPQPAGPGLPEHAPSVYRIHAPAAATLGRDLSIGSAVRTGAAGPHAASSTNRE